MKFFESDLKGVFVIEPMVFEDDRGYFMETFHQSKFEENLGRITWKQDNESLSQAGVVRGLHAQKPPMAQAKLVRVIKGAVMDVVVDIRKHSPTYGRSFCIELNEENKKMLFIPSGFLHGFKTLVNQTIFSYKCSELYAPDHEIAVRWNDPDLSINWETQEPIVSEKDKSAPFFRDFKTPF